MRIKNFSVTQIAHPETIIEDGVIHYELNFRCDHAQAVVIKGEYPFATYGVVCIGCHGEDLTEEECDNMILSHIEELEGMSL